MEKDMELLAARFRDLAARSYKNNIYTNTAFLTPAEQEVFYEIRKELDYAAPVLWGGKEESERKILRFGSETALGYDEAPPIAILIITPLMQKFADDLTHRDFLGAVLNLGIERSVIGDILVKPGAAAMFTMEHVADMICEELIRIRHTSVKVVRIAPELLDEEGFKTEFEEIRKSAASLRADAVISGVCNLSRANAQNLFKAGYVVLNGRLLEKYETELKPGDIFTVRGFGKYVFDGEEGVSRKGRSWFTVRRYK